MKQLKKKFDDPALQAAFQRMYDTESALDDMDYLRDTPKLQEAMKAADEFRELLDKADRSRRKNCGISQ